MFKDMFLQLQVRRSWVQCGSNVAASERTPMVSTSWATRPEPR